MAAVILMLLFLAAAGFVVAGSRMADALELLRQVIAPRAKAVEGDYRPGPYFLGDDWLSATAGKFINFWQMGSSARPYDGSNAMVKANSIAAIG